MRSTRIALMLILPAVGLAIGCAGLVNLKRFAARKRQIDTPSDLEAFRRPSP